ncbi:MAG: hypothetical protein ACRDUY_07780, partial [Nitriliruptorales bacterium]
MSETVIQEFPTPQGEGIVDFTVTSKPASPKDYYGSEGIDIHYVFASPRDPVDAVAKFAEIQGLAHDQAKAQLDQLVAQRDAQAAQFS